MDFKQTTQFDLSFTVEIGGLKPNTAYSFYYILTNDASACEKKTEDDPEQFIFSTGEASLPSMIPHIQLIGATGGGIHVAVTPPTDKGSDEELYYQIYMSESRVPKNWKLSYNGTDVSFWQTKLQKETNYYFRASCMNEVGYSDNSTVFKLQTTLISPPGPPSGLEIINSTGGTVKFSWKSPEDDGGSMITSYSVHAQDAIGSPELVQKTDSSEILFGGLLENRLYNFKVFAENNLGTGSDPGQKSISTTMATLPSLPGDPVIKQMSGGSVTFAVQSPQDTGGVSVDDLVWNVYANGVKVSPDAVRRRPSPSTTTGSTTRRLTSTDVRTSIYVQAGGLLPSTTYTFTVQVANGVGASDMTNGAKDATSVATVPGAPDPPTAILITGGSMELSWTDPVDSGGAPLISYKLSVNRSGSEVGKCEGMFLSCTIGNLLSITDYVVTLVAYNPVGASPPSAITTFTTKVTSLPQAPQGVHVAEVSNTSVTIHWDPCLDFGGGYVETYQVDIVQTLNTSIAFSGRVPVAQLNYSMAGLTPSTDYNSTVVRVP